MAHDWLPIPSHCIHCGMQLEARPKMSQAGIVIEGFEPMEYRHAGASDCVQARPYSDANQFASYQRALRAMRSRAVDDRDEQNRRYDPMSRDDLINECERLRAVLRWIASGTDASAQVARDALRDEP